MLDEPYGQARHEGLLDIGSGGGLCLSKDFTDNIPVYAILSHTRGADEDDVTFNDIHSGSGTSKDGDTKTQACGQQARKNGLRYLWVDICCIYKANHTELSATITSMFAAALTQLDATCTHRICQLGTRTITARASDRGNRPFARANASDEAGRYMNCSLRTIGRTLCARRRVPR